MHRFARLTTLSFLLIALGPGAAAQEVAWEASSGLLPWDASIPAQHLFAVSGTPSQAAMVGGAMHVNDTSIPESFGVSKSDIDAQCVDGDWTIEAVVRMNSCDRVDPWVDLGTHISVSGGGRFVGAGIDEEGVGFTDIPSTQWVGGLKHVADLSTAFHTFRVVKADGMVALFLDGGALPVIELPFTSFPAIGARNIDLGTTSIIGTSDWDQLSFVFTPDPWADLGSGLGGAVGVPVLAGTGSLVGGQPITLDLSDALPGSTTTLVVGFAALDAPFKGGTLVPAPNLLFTGLPIDAAGSFVLNATWPLGLPSGATLFFQHWVVDAAGPQGFSASNGLAATTP